MRVSHGAVYVAGFRWTGYDLLHYQRDVRRIQGEAICFSSFVETHGDGGLVRKEERQGILRLDGSGKTCPAGCRPARFEIVTAERERLDADVLIVGAGP